jgi:RNA polymerase sigma-70 factor (ECF subfamily)
VCIFRVTFSTVLVLLLSHVVARSQEVTLETAPPVVVTTVPAAGSADVDPALTEIQVTFSKDMRDRNWSMLGEASTPEMPGQPRYDGKRTCILPVKLKPGQTYAFCLNSQKFRNFKDESGQPAVPYLLVFRTKG